MQLNLIGQSIKGKYKIYEFLGEKGTTQMFAAQNMMNGQDVEIEFFGSSFPIEAVQVQPIMNHMITLSALDHPNLARVTDMGVHQEIAFIVRECLEGQYLQTLIDETYKTPIAKERGVNIIYQIGQALAYGEKFSLSHGQLHPMNVFVTKTGRAVVINLGVRPILERIKGRDKNYLQTDIRALGALFDKLLLMTDVSADVEQTIFRILGIGGMPYNSYQELLVDLEFLRSNVQTTMLGSGSLKAITAELGLDSPSTLTATEEEKHAIVSLYFPEIGFRYEINEPGEYTIGRRFKGQPILPDIDLTDYDAYQWGISKMHAVVRVNGPDQIYLSDSGSSNGTLAKGVKLEPNRFHQIEPQATYHFGRLKVQFLVYGNSEFDLWGF